MNRSAPRRLLTNETKFFWKMIAKTVPWKEFGRDEVGVAEKSEPGRDVVDGVSPRDARRLHPVVGPEAREESVARRHRRAGVVEDVGRQRLSACGPARGPNRAGDRGPEVRRDQQGRVQDQLGVGSAEHLGTDGDAGGLADGNGREPGEEPGHRLRLVGIDPGGVAEGGRIRDPADVGGLHEVEEAVQERVGCSVPRAPDLIAAHDDRVEIVPGDGPGHRRAVAEGAAAAWDVAVYERVMRPGAQPPPAQAVDVLAGKPLQDRPAENL